MKGHSSRSTGAVACAALLAIGLPAAAAAIVAGSGTSPPTTATGIYEIAVVKIDSGLRQHALALVHKGALREVHSRGATGYQRRVGGSSNIRVSPSKYDSLAGIPTSGLGCATPSGLPDPAPPFDTTVCPDDYELKVSIVNGKSVIQCIRPTTTTNLLPAVSGRYVGSLFGVTIGWLNDGS